MASGLIAHLPELGRLDRRAIASLGVLAPRKPGESGKWKGHRRIGQGRRHVRRLPYMAPLATWRRPDAFGGFARKLLTIANAVLRDATPFHASHPA